MKAEEANPNPPPPVKKKKKNPVNNIGCKLFVIIFLLLPVLLTFLYLIPLSTVKDDKIDAKTFFCDFFGMISFSSLTFALLFGSKFHFIFRVYGKRWMLILHRCAAVVFLIFFIIHVVFVFLMPKVEKLPKKTFASVVFDFKNTISVTNAIASICVIISLPLMLLACFGKPALKSGIPWKIWKRPHYFLYLIYFAIAAHTIVMSAQQQFPYPSLFHLVNTIFCTLLGVVGFVMRMYKILCRPKRKKRNKKSKVEPSTTAEPGAEAGGDVSRETVTQPPVADDSTISEDSSDDSRSVTVSESEGSAHDVLQYSGSMGADWGGGGYQRGYGYEEYASTESEHEYNKNTNEDEDYSGLSPLNVEHEQYED